MLVNMFVKFFFRKAILFWCAIVCRVLYFFLYRQKVSNLLHILLIHSIKTTNTFIFKSLWVKHAYPICIYVCIHWYTLKNRLHSYYSDHSCIHMYMYTYRLMCMMCTYFLFTQGNKQCAYVKIFIRLIFFSFTIIHIYAHMFINAWMHALTYICMNIHT